MMLFGKHHSPVAREQRVLEVDVPDDGGEANSNLGGDPMYEGYSGLSCLRQAKQD